MQVAALSLMAAAPALAGTIRVAAGPDAQERLQAALIEAKPGDMVDMDAGRFDLTDGLSLDVNGVTIRGAGPVNPIWSHECKALNRASPCRNLAAQRCTPKAST
jgi:hypothetical protein